jgi:hypothetical protein
METYKADTRAKALGYGRGRSGKDAWQRGEKPSCEGLLREEEGQG